MGGFCSKVKWWRQSDAQEISTLQKMLSDDTVFALDKLPSLKFQYQVCSILNSNQIYG